MSNNKIAVELIETYNREWRSAYIKEFEARACSDLFPCIYVKQGYKKGYFSFHFMEDPFNEHERQDAFDAMKGYVANVLATPDDLIAAMKILLIVVNSKAFVGSHEKMAWKLLSDFVQRDDVAWPDQWTQNPEDESWAYCFQGERLFVNISSPEHQLRHSRNIGGQLVIVVQMRDGIDYIAPPNAKGNGIRSFIRQRINNYDSIPVSKDLATHGQGQNRDWKQFWLGDRGFASQEVCPFQFFKKN